MTQGKHKDVLYLCDGRGKRKEKMRLDSVEKMREMQVTRCFTEKNKFL